MRSINAFPKARETASIASPVIGPLTNGSMNSFGRWGNFVAPVLLGLACLLLFHQGMPRTRNRGQARGGWFKWILSRLIAASVAEYLKPKGLENYRVLAVDASDVNSGVSRFSKS
jgi:hypothetical protein